MTFPPSAIACLLLALLPAAMAASAGFTLPSSSVNGAPAYKGAIAMDASTGDVLFEDRADTVGPPASMTKLMTFAVVQDRIAAGALTLRTPVPIDPADARMGGTQVYLDPRETFSVEELLYAMMIQSANDAAHALARAAAGSVPAFVEEMNAKARELGMTDTVFRTPHGLPPPSRRTAEGDLTSPRDFAKLSRHLISQTDVLRYTSIRLREFGTGVRAEPMQMVNHNKLVEKVAGVDGLKTGFTNGAGFCLAATAERGGRRVIVVTMGSPSQKTRDLMVVDLLERSFAALTAPATRAAPRRPATAANPPTSPLRPAPSAAAPAAEAPPVIKFSIPKR